MINLIFLIINDQTDFFIINDQSDFLISNPPSIYVFFISFLEVSGSHTDQVLCDKLMGSLLEFNIERKLPFIIVDNVATNDHMIDFMLLVQDKNDLILGGQKFHARCCAHIMNLIVKDGLSVIGDLTTNICESYFFVRIN